MARRAETSTIMIRSCRVARMRAVSTLIDSPRISPILRRATIGSAANTPSPSIALGPTSTANFWYAGRAAAASARATDALLATRQHGRDALEDAAQLLPGAL